MMSNEWIVNTSTEPELQRKSAYLVEECESILPRNQACVIEMKAVVKENTND